MILITGASGQLGRQVIEGLLATEPADQIIAGVRDRTRVADLEDRGIQIRHLDYNQPATIPSALAGADKALLVSSNDPVNSLAQHTAVIKAASEVGVSLLAYTSILHADVSTLLVARSGKLTEPVIRDSGLPFVILRNSLYQELFAPAIRQALVTGVIVGTAGEGRAATATRTDYAAAAVAVLTGNGHEGKTYELSGDAAWSFNELVAELTRLSGTEVTYRSVSSGEHLALLLAGGMPAPVAGAFVNTYQGIRAGELEDTSGDLQRLIGRPTTPLRSTLQAVVGQPVP
jgi:NAD(P)H dehydrogenase (quinone)